MSKIEDTTTRCSACSTVWVQGYNCVCSKCVTRIGRGGVRRGFSLTQRWVDSEEKENIFYKLDLILSDPDKIKR